MTTVVGAGLEGVVIRTAPAYPNPASLGFNMEDVYRNLPANGLVPVEYELYMVFLSFTETKESLSMLVSGRQEFFQ
jgi:hypothetical protein